MKECRISAANSAVKIYPAYRIELIEVPLFNKKFVDKDELGKKIYGVQYNGRMQFSVGDIKAYEHFSCFFISYDKRKWSFNWAGIGPTAY